MRNEKCPIHISDKYIFRGIIWGPENSKEVSRTFEGLNLLGFVKLCQRLIGHFTPGIFETSET